MSEFRDLPPEDKPQRRNYEPAPGRVTVLRDVGKNQIEGTSLDLVKHDDYVKMDDAFSIYATVAVVGKPVNGTEPWFERGDKVTIEPGLFREIELAPGLTVWNGAWAGITGVFVAEEESA